MNNLATQYAYHLKAAREISKGVIGKEKLRAVYLHFAYKAKLPTSKRLYAEALEHSAPYDNKSVSKLIRTLAIHAAVYDCTGTNLDC